MNKKVSEIIKKNKYRAEFYQTVKNTQKKHKENQSNKQAKWLANFTNKVLMSICILFILLISGKNDKLSFIYDATFNHMNMMRIQTFVDDKLGGIFPKTDNPNKYVGSIYIDMNDTTNYKDGIIIKTNYSEPVESCVDGIVIMIYQDAELGKVYVIQDDLGREYHYSYLADSNLTMYHHVEYGDILGIGQMTDDMDGMYYLAIIDGNETLDVINVINDEN